jgi:hypothetical protein
MFLRPLLSGQVQRLYGAQHAVESKSVSGCERVWYRVAQGRGTKVFERPGGGTGGEAQAGRQRVCLDGPKWPKRVISPNMSQ